MGCETGRALKGDDSPKPELQPEAGNNVWGAFADTCPSDPPRYLWLRGPFVAFSIAFFKRQLACS